MAAVPSVMAIPFPGVRATGANDKKTLCLREAFTEGRKRLESSPTAASRERSSSRCHKIVPQLECCSGTRRNQCV
jgi:hypothetical protein